ncbi:hypothetical protein BXU11_04210 [Flavobacterium sp. LM5]|uniref:RHS repeat-associated core domain-containing protein n=1 Tax=Flavobacterium sp. LM5 TaxID=1938610 RepID=UPI0009920868|nr:RHS repeat-associated core domain-containing protein [Flavobacterium sp. LM5]OOV29135.1 hypothetical protein BXU11_04210 [Flavobacterium sp. LM5]
MKKLYILFVFLSQLIFSQNFTDTKGELQISGSGTATYSLPIALPPSIKNVAPVINLTYSSGVRGGIAGQGWSINSISSITRMSTRRDIDGFVDGVDFDSEDKLALDGQRLLIKSGTYWGNGSTYETEYKSNTKIEYVMQGSMTFFIVTAPDGSRSWYGSTGNGTYQNAVSATAWHIVRFEDASGNRIDYNYTNVVYKATNQLYIASISFSGNPTAGIAFQNSIVFNFRDAKRVERDFINGNANYASKILESVDVLTNNTVFRKYKLTHVEDTSLGYERVSQIQEYNAQNEASNPVVFEYAQSPTNLERTEKTYTNTLAFDKVDLAGDFDGDGRLDFVANNQVFTKLFEANAGNTPVALPFTSDKRKLFTATTLTNNKLNQFQSIVHANETATGTEFKVYNFSNNSFLSSYNKTITIDNIAHLGSETNYDYYCSYDEYNCGYEANNSNCSFSGIKNSTSYLEGDFNGDGISEVLIMSRANETHDIYRTTYYTNYGYNLIDCVDSIREPNNVEYFLVDLNPNSSNQLNSSSYVKLLNSSLLGGFDTGETKIVADFNSDGKSDVLVIYLNGTYKIVGFKQLTASPWIELEIIGQGIIDKYSNKKQILFGDYNGDGKTDIMLPDTEGGSGHTLWHIYYGNPKSTGGEFFTKESQNIVEYWPNTGTYYNTQTHFSTYYAIDINKDGKSDLVRVWRKYYKPKWTINDHNTQWQVTGFTNNIGRATSPGFNLTYDSGLFDSGSPDIPIPLVSNFKYNGANTDLVLVRGHYNKIEYYQFNKNVETENRLVSVTESAGNIKQTIDYKPMEASNASFGFAATDFYSSSDSATYPNIEIIRNPTSFLVSKLTATINGVSKYQDFRYRGYVSNYNYGTVGFIRSTRSSWYLSDADTKIWSTQHNDITLKGANTITWSSTIGATVFDPVPTGLLSTKTNTFETYTNPTSKVYNVLLNKQTTVDALTGVISEDTFTYDGLVTSASYYGLETQRVSKKMIGSAVQGTSTSTTTYDSNPTGVGASYYIGRPKTIATSTSNSTGDTRTSSETYTYTGTNLSKTEKTGHNTGYALVEDMTYDAVGNLLTKTISAPGATNPVAARTITDEYDTSKKFVLKKTDHQGFSAQFLYNALGQVLTSTNYLGVITSNGYDNWGKLISTTITNASATPINTNIVYAKLGNGGYTTTTTNTLNALTVVEYDVLGREVRSSIKGMAAGSTVSKQVVYDGLGRKTKESEPYFSTPSRWTSYEYDFLQRPTKVTAPTGRIQTLSYSGLTTTSIDDGKTTTTTLDALGNKIETTDPGGVIAFTYYANGQLKESNYEGHKVTISIDGWGNKIAMNDPNAGNYTYTYDAFGQSLTETTPKGSTTNTYDAYGKLSKKKLVGDGTDIETDYTYNALAQLTNESSKKSNGTSIDAFTYGYDSLKRLVTTTESNSRFTQTKTITFDTFSRPITGTTTTQELITGMVATVVTKNNYNTYNGIMDKITDGNDAVLWQLNTANEKMQSLTDTLGNGITITNAYTVDGYFSSQKHMLSSTAILHNTYNFNGVKGTLDSRQNLALGTSESFTYDNLDRLTQWTNPLNGTTDSNSYDNKGRITSNNKLGTVTYNANLSTGIYRKSSILLTPEGKNYYTTLPKQVVSYTMFKSPISINESDKGSTAFTYNSHLSRQTMNYGFTITPPATTGVYTKTKDYTDDGTVEIIKTPTTITIRTYIGGDAYDAPLYVEKIKTIATGAVVDKKYYLHRDYLGSIIAISDENGVALERRHFDAWGNLAKLQQNGVAITLPTDGTGAKLLLLDRGYTSHEHLAEVGLIHMNGRLYDPVLRSFLMPDNFIQQPENTQNYNRYAYVLNNPLMYTDPSGEIGVFLAIGIGALVAATTYTMTALLADVPFSVGGLLKSTFIGAASAAVTFGIGTAAGNLFSNFYSQAAFQAAAHGTFQGGMTAISGGKFWSGFAAGALSSIASSAWGGGMSSETVDDVTTQTIHKGLSGASGMNNGFGTIAFGTVTGGVSAKLTGGNFWQGAVTGLFVSALNHTFHESGDKNKTGLSTRRYHKDADGNIDSESLNYHNKNQNPELYARAEAEPLRMNELTIYGHGSQTSLMGVGGLSNSNLITAKLYADSVMFRNFIDGNSKSLTMVLKVCTTGEMRYYGNNIAKVLSKTPGLTIYAAAGYFFPSGKVGFHSGGAFHSAGYNKFQNGEFKYNVGNK